jgi:hypothetical protein
MVTGVAATQGQAVQGAGAAPVQAGLLAATSDEGLEYFVPLPDTVRLAANLFI